MQSGSAGLRAVRAGRTGAGLMGFAMGTNLPIMTGYRNLMFGRRFHFGLKHQRTRLLNQKPRIHLKSKPTGRPRPQQHVKCEETPGAVQPNTGRWNLLVLLVGRGRHVQALEELVELSHLLLRLVARQFEVHTAERIRRGLQLYSAYSRLWGEEAARALLSSLRRLLLARGRHFLLSAVCFSQYDWEANRISSDIMNSAVRDLESVEDLCKATVQCDDCGKRQVIDQQMIDIEYCMCNGQVGYTDTSRMYDSWEPFIERKHHIVWRQKHEVHQHLYAFKVYGTYDDVSLSAFMEVHLNSDFRTEWDDTALQLSVLDSNKDSNSDLIYWLVKYPKFFANRDYIYKRRFSWNAEKQEAVIMNEAIAPDHVPEEKGIFRVNEYWSRMVIRAKKDANEPGLEYTLTYFDNPGTSLPQWMTNFIAVTGFPRFLDKVHEVAIGLQSIHERGKDVYVSLPSKLRYPITPKIEVSALEKPFDLDVTPRKDTVPSLIEEIPEVTVAIGIADVQLPVVRDVEENFNKDLRIIDDYKNLPAEQGDLQSSEVKIIEESNISRFDGTIEVGNQNLAISPILEESELSVEEKLFSTGVIDNSDNQGKLLNENEEAVLRGAVTSSDVIEMNSEVSEELCFEVTPDIKTNIVDVATSDSDKLLSVQRGTKKVEVQILEGMEVVAPDLDEQTTLSKNVEILTVKALEELESKTVLVENLQKLRNRLKLFHKNASEKKKSSMKKMQEFQERGHYDLDDDQTRKHFERLFEAMREVLQADKEMRTGRGLMHKPSQIDEKEIFTEVIPDAESYQSTPVLETDKQNRESEDKSPSSEDVECPSTGRKVDERGHTNSRPKTKSSDDPPPPPPPNSSASVGLSDTSTESAENEETASNVIETYNGLDSISGSTQNITPNNGKTWLRIPYFTNWWETESKVPGLAVRHETIQECNVSGESISLTNEQSTLTTVIDQVWYVVGLGWVFQTKSEVSVDPEKMVEESVSSNLSSNTDKDGTYNWYWYPFNGAYRMYSWAFKSKENA